jgi:hypothetical protein
LLNQLWRIRKFLALVAIVGVVVGFYALNSSYNCNLRETTHPTIATYPNSTLIEENVQYDTSNGKIINTSYEAAQVSDNVISFYRDNAELCSGIFEGRVQCHGRAEPFGRYTVSINVSPAAPTTYVVEMRWDKCGRGEGVSFDR